MSGKAPGPIRQAWYRWKALKLPWRKRFLVGLDLQGNTFWEFRDTLSSHKHRMRRIVEYPPATHYSEIKISPQWHQWLRHTRLDAPSLTEQSQDLVRQRNLKILAQQADERWAAKPSFLDKPKESQQALPATEVKDKGGYVESGETEDKMGVRNIIGGGLDDKIQNTETTFGEALEKQEEPTKEEQDTQPEESARRQPSARVKEKKVDNDPWKQARGGPSEEWQPDSWSGSLAPRKR